MAYPSSPALFLVFLYVLCSSSLIPRSSSSSSSSSCCGRPMAGAPRPNPPEYDFTLESVRDSLIRQEDSIVFCLIERSRFPYNAPTYEPSGGSHGGSLVEFFVKESEVLDAKVGLYLNPEEVPFFPDNLPTPLVTPNNYSQVLHPASAPVSISQKIWDMYFKDLLPLFTTKGDDGNYAATAASDLVCLQALSRRIHYGKFVAEVKFKDALGDYTPAIQAQDRDGLMKLLTFESVEQSVKRRVAKKAMVFGQNVTLDDGGDEASANDDKARYKVDPSVVSRLYGEWVMPLTKLVQVEYLLHRLDK